MRYKVDPLVRTVRGIGVPENERSEPKASAAEGLSQEDVRSVVRAVHVVPETAGGWEVRKGGRRRIIRHFETREAAVSYAEKLSGEGCDLYIHEGPPGALIKPLRAGS